MISPIFTPHINGYYSSLLTVFIETTIERIIPNEINIYSYRVGRGCFHVLQLDNEIEITITEGKVDIPDRADCLDSLRVGHIQVGVFDSVDVAYMKEHILEQFKSKNKDLNITHSRGSNRGEE